MKDVHDSTVEIPNRATQWPVALTDLMLAAPLASRLLLGATWPGQLVQAAAVGAYAGSALRDWRERRRTVRVDFLRCFGADHDALEEMPVEEREREMHALARVMNDAWTCERIDASRLPAVVDAHVVAFIASLTGQRVTSSTRVRQWSAARLVFPFAYGVCDVLSGEIAIFQDLGILAPHVVAHELCHRKGYWKELHAQVLAYLALRWSGDAVLVQAARAERLHRHLRVMAPDGEAYVDVVGSLGLRDELRAALLSLHGAPGVYEAAVSAVMRPLYQKRMELTGQKASDYDEGFTSFLWTFGRSREAVVDPELARRL